jgi:hypothetical protein
MKPVTFDVSGIRYGPEEINQLRSALVKKADNGVKSNLTESILIFQAVALLLHMSEAIWPETEVEYETRNIQSDKNSSGSSEGKVRTGTPGLVE